MKRIGCKKNKGGKKGKTLALFAPFVLFAARDLHRQTDSLIKVSPHQTNPGLSRNCLPQKQVRASASQAFFRGQKVKEQNIFSIAVLPGDGIGGDVIAEGVKVLRAVEAKLGAAQFELREYSVGAGEYLTNGDPLPPQTFERIKQHDAILLGAMGLPDVRYPDGVEMTPQVDLREWLDLYCGLRPIRLYHADDTLLKNYDAGEIDFLLVRESTEGLFAARKSKTLPEANEANDTMRITRRGSERLFRAAFREARRRRNKVTLVDKANVLPSMAYFRGIFDEISREFADVETERVYVDAMSLYLVQRPQSFDVVVTENMFGDILSDLAAGLVGGMGMAPSADIGDRHAVFQPSHGSAPDIAGKGIANPIATILSVKMMLEWLGQAAGAAMIARAVETVMRDPTLRTADMGGTLSTSAMGDLIARHIDEVEL
jgi:3-isopropylmalate dehydrogenase